MATRESPKSSERALEKIQTESDGPDHQNKEKAPQQIVAKRKRLTPNQKLAFLLAISSLPLIVIWSLRPFDRIINLLLPPEVPTTNQEERSTNTEPIFAHPLFLNRSKFQFRQCGPNATLCCNGLENLCDLKANEVMFASLHNAMATKEDGYLLHPSHYLSLESALEAGYRGIHLEVCKCNGVYEFCHGICRLGARNPIEVFLNIDRFLRDNRQDVLLLNLQINNHAHQEVDLMEFYQLMRNSTRFSKNLYYREKEDEEWPTLKRMIGDDKRIILFHSNGPNCANATCPLGFHYSPDYWHETYVAVGQEFLEDSCIMRPSNSEKDPSQQFYSLNHFVSSPNHSVSEHLNSFDFISQRIASCAEVQSINNIVVDFWNIGNVVEFVQRHNKGRLISA